MTASDHFQIELLSGREQTADDRLGPRDWAALALRLLVAVAFFELIPFEPKQRVVVRARSTGQVVLVHDWGRNGEGARLDRVAITAASEKLSLPDFAQEYGVTCGATRRPCNGEFADHEIRRPGTPARHPTAQERVNPGIADDVGWWAMTMVARLVGSLARRVRPRPDRPHPATGPVDRVTTCWCSLPGDT